ncbi:MAG TPA: hypothetical protein VKO66_06040, partial [Sideroxyarcus sp.]|nr:hypothetical protein [Sideroxyarcus sp.]
MIRYTGHGIGDAPYSVTFTRDRELGEPRRPDIQISANGGFKQVTADLLRKIEIRYGASLVRSYEFRYKAGAFNKTLLDHVVQYGADGVSEFNRHVFAYYDEVWNGQAAYDGFNQSRTWTTQDDHLGQSFLGTHVGPSALGGSEGNTIGGSFSMGFAPFPTKYLSFNGMVGNNISRTEGTLALMDIDGDGLPDKVYRSGNEFKYHRNTSTPNADPTSSIVFDSYGRGATGLSAISKDTTQSFNFGGQVFVAGLNVIQDTAFSMTTQDTYLSDVNGDGLVDVVNNGQVLFSRRDADKEIRYLATSSGTESPIGAGVVNAAGMLPVASFVDIENRLLEQNPLADAVRRWVAPFDGVVRVEGGVQLVNVLTDPKKTDKEKEARSNYRTADGVRVSIEKAGVGAPLWAQTIGASDFSTVYQPENVDSIAVNKGAVLYFRVQSIFDGAYDEVKWSPRVTYVGKPDGVTDQNGLNPYQYNAASDFTYGGRIVAIDAPFRGKLRLGGTLKKTAVTSDDVTLSLYQIAAAESDTYFKNQRDFSLLHLNRAPVARVTVPAANIDDIVLDSLPDLPVNAHDLLFMIVESDSNIDLGKLAWKDDGKPSIFYVEAFYPDQAPSSTSGGDPLKDANGNPIGYTPGASIKVWDDSEKKWVIQLHPSHEFNFYPDNTLTDAQQNWVPGESGMMVVVPTITPKPVLDPLTDKTSNVFDHDTEVTLTVKRRGELLGKHVMRLAKGSKFNPGAHSVVIPAQKGDGIFFDLSTRDMELAPTLQDTNVQAYYLRPLYSAPLGAIPVNQTGKSLNWAAPAGTVTVFPVLVAKAGAAAMKGEVVLHVVRNTTNTDGTSKREAIADRIISFDTSAQFKPNDHAFNIDMPGDSLDFSYTTDSVALAQQLASASANVVVTQNYVHQDYEFKNLPLTIVQNGGQGGTGTSTAKIPVGSSGVMTVTPTVSANGGIPAVDASLTLIVSRQYTKTDAQGNVVKDANGNPVVVTTDVASYPVTLVTGQHYNSGAHTFDVAINQNETMLFRFETADATLAGSDFGLGVWAQVRQYLGSGANMLNVPNALHSYGSSTFFPNSYRGWSLAGYNGNGDYATKVINPARFTYPSSQSGYNVPSDTDAAKTKAGETKVSNQTAFPAAAQPDQYRWFIGDERWWITANTMSSSRMGIDYVRLPRPEDIVTTTSGGAPGIGAGATGVPRMSMVVGGNTMGVGFLVNISNSQTPVKGLLDYLDLNGDRFPDVVGGGTVQFTRMDGGLGDGSLSTDRRSSAGSEVRKSQSDATSIAPGGTVPKTPSNGQGKPNPPGATASGTSQNGNFGFTGSLGFRDNSTDTDFVDVNGDGLPDRVTQGPPDPVTRSRNISVALNLGYDFAGEETWGSA